MSTENTTKLRPTVGALVGGEPSPTLPLDIRSRREAGAYGVGYLHALQRREPLYPLVADAAADVARDPDAGARGTPASIDSVAADSGFDETYFLGFTNGVQAAHGEPLSPTVPWDEIAQAAAHAHGCERIPADSDIFDLSTPTARREFVTAVMVAYHGLHMQPVQQVADDAAGLTDAEDVARHDVVVEAPGAASVSEESAS